MLDLISSPVLRQYISVIITNFTILHMGLHLSWPSPVLIKLRQDDQTILNTQPTTPQESWIVSITELAGVFTLLFTGKLVSFFGRKRMILCMGVPRLTMCLLYLFASEVWMIILGRAIGGVADVICLSAVATYSAEVAGKKIRGASGTVIQFMSATGGMTMLSVGPYISYQAVNLMVMCIVVVTYIPILFVPESPYFLYAKGRTHDALEALTFLRGSEIEANEELKEYAMQKKSNKKVDAMSFLKDKVTIKTFVLVIILSLGLVMIGYNAVNYYLQTIFELAQTNISSELSSLIAGVTQLLACSCTFFLTDRLGRKPILCVTLIVLGTGMFGLGTFFVLLDNGHEITRFLNYVPLLSIILVKFGHDAGMGCIFWMVVAELFDGPVRPYGVSCGILTAGLSLFALSFSFPYLIDSIGSAAMYYTFASCNVMVCLIIYFFVPETKGRTFVEIQKALGRKITDEVKEETNDKERSYGSFGQS